MFKLGIAYWEGTGVEQDERRAIQLFKQAAEAGNSEAMYVYAEVSAGLFSGLFVSFVAGADPVAVVVGAVGDEVVTLTYCSPTASGKRRRGTPP